MSENIPNNILPSPDVICQELDGELVILDLQQEQYFGLNEVGTRMWKLMSKGVCADQIVKTLLNEFDVDESTLRRDLTALTEQLMKANLARIAA